MMNNIRCALTVAMLLLLMAAPLSAAEATYPKESPRFSIQVPEGLKPIYRGDSLVLLPIPEDGFLIQVNKQPAAAQKALRAITERVASEMKLTDMEIGTPSEAENAQEVECTVITSTGKADGVPVVITVVAFSIEDEKNFTIQSVGSADVNKKHGFELLNIIDSIKPLESE
jgi:hypothetical protein